MGLGRGRVKRYRLLEGLQGIFVLGLAFTEQAHVDGVGTWSGPS